MADYLDSYSIGAAYNFTHVNFSGGADITEHLFYLSGRQIIFSDILPGKLILRLDAYFGRHTLAYHGSTTRIVGGGMGGGGGGMSGGTTTTTTSPPDETTNITSWQPIVSFINFSKTLYLDLGYAHSNYDNNPDLTVNQFTPSLGFGWNESYDWLQLRAYVISLDQTTTAFNDDRFSSLELQYSHWFRDASLPRLELFRLTLLGGDRVLAIDPDAGTIYSTADRQRGSLAASMQWALKPTLKFLGLVSYSRYHNDIAINDYNSLLFYINLQHQW